MPLPFEQLAAIRLGFGLSPQNNIPTDPAGLARSVSASGPEQDSITLDQVRQWHREGQLLSRDARNGTKDQQKADRSHRQNMRALFNTAVLRRFARAVDDPTGFGERLVWFWSDHFTVSGGSVYFNLMSDAFVQDAIRPHLTGRFADMMFAAETHPAMLRYLDQTSSIGPNSVLARQKPDKPGGLNENLAREMIELHSMGVGAEYTQADVEQLARLLTGLTYNPRQNTVFRARRAEPGADTVLGESYGGDGKASLGDIRAVIENLATQDATARHIARKMAVHFISDTPPDALIDRLAQVFRDTDGDLAAMNLALAESPELEQGFRTKMRQPFEFLVASMRSLGMTGAQVDGLKPAALRRHLLEPMAIMGQPWAAPDGPDGWSEAAEDWASPQGIAMRINWAMTSPSDLLAELPDPRNLLRDCLGDTASEAVTWAIPRAESRTEGVALVLASADFNRR
ncbi:DUF1800 family protein [Paracoccus sp. JM45]|uniref:DUF1800 domain-containing protein n=1 Tax=Paracoccus sp. JM45 TaxID=2283626 RepID=UPI000E6C5B99|nr:DUF1800 domain-containing protein [Paracoccus sp. JM45]RJE81547.1 DUF1800 domain-containing protein [Paracoccus sp. JM45]